MKKTIAVVICVDKETKIGRVEKLIVNLLKVVLSLIPAKNVQISASEKEFDNDEGTVDMTIQASWD